MSVTEDIQQLKQELIELRRDFHQYPESGWLEYRTSAKIADKLFDNGYEVFVGKDVCESTSRMGVPCVNVLKENKKRALSEGANPKWVEQMTGGHTGVVGVLKTNKPGPTIALRFDIDSLDIQESSRADHIPATKGFRSKHEGMMHACGHDGHASIGLGVATILAKHIDKLSGEIRLLFQPAEEGCRGAKSVVNKGWLKDVDYFFSGHIAFQSFHLGEIVTAVGGFFATTKLDVKYKGKAGHAGDKPEIGKNALLAAASASIHLHSIPRHSAGKTRINVGQLNAGSGRNVIPDIATMSVETRGETTEINEFMTQEAIRIIEGIAQAYDVDCEWRLVGQASGAQSDQAFMDELIPEIEATRDVSSIVSYRELNASEDAVYMMNYVQKQGGKASYLLFGTPLAAGHHHAQFDFDENVLHIGTEVFTRIVLACTKRG
ncbi:amidohydrolase [Virgibacillus sp. W0430]|uniref:amidohydrolase n=1 Tax=Virgibacillus sp. W0430 TaxID=3391580 RepID=UPI003F459BD1